MTHNFIFQKISDKFLYTLTYIIYYMSGTIFQQQVLGKLANIEKNINSLKTEVDYIMEYIEDSKLTDEEQKLLEEALEDRKQGKLLSSKEVFG